jgi:hypothetical protein
VLAFFAADFANHLDELELLGMGSVREIEAGHIEAGAEQFAENRFIGRGRPERRDDLGAARVLPNKA